MGAAISEAWPKQTHAAAMAGRCALPAAGLAAAFALWVGPGGATSLVLGGGLALVVAQIVWLDVVALVISNGALMALALLGCLSRLLGPGPEADVTVFLLDAGLCGGAVWLLRETFYRRRGYDGIGLGDVKLAGAGGLLVGLEGLAWSILLASLGGLALVGVLRSLKRPLGPSDRLPFGALLAPVLLLTWALGPTS